MQPSDGPYFMGCLERKFLCSAVVQGIVRTSRADSFFGHLFRVHYERSFEQGGSVRLRLHSLLLDVLVKTTFRAFLAFALRSCRHLRGCTFAGRPLPSERPSWADPATLVIAVPKLAVESAYSASITI